MRFNRLSLLPMKQLRINWVAFLVFSCFSCAGVFAQTGTVKGKVIDPNNDPISGVSVRVQGTDILRRTDAAGAYEITLPANRVYRISFTHAAHQAAQLEIRIVDGVTYDRPVKMISISLEDVVIGEQKTTDFSDVPQMQISPIDAEEIIKIPTANPSIEAFVKTMPGVSSNNEFSSQYQVRGGNFDENLVYVNGIEIYRPFLARSGQQEGLGFAHPNLTKDIKFSTGGFPSQYGDKLSSVLDVTYKDPKEFRGTVEAGIITSNVHLEGRSKNRKNPDRPGAFSYLIGTRRFAMSYFLNSLNTKGDYRPNFLDFQGMFTYTPGINKNRPYYRIIERDNGTIDTLYFANEKLKFTTFIALTRNRYQFEPSGRETTFGTIQQAFRLRVAFEGREVSNYTTGLGALMATHRPNARLKLDYILTGFRTEESELIDVEGGYLLGEVNTSFGSEEFNEAEFDRGIGTQFRHARNYLTANVVSGQFKGEWTTDNSSRHKFYFGLSARYQQIDDALKEYAALDSAGYLVDENGLFGLDEFIRGAARLNSVLAKGYLQYQVQLDKYRASSLVLGSRLVYYDLTGDWMVSPRLQYAYDMSRLPNGPDLRLRLATGLYQQPPFYREFRRLDGSLNLDIKPQTSLHMIAGLDYQFRGWGRTFKLFSEAYYKHLDNIIPYEVQNVRIRYYPDEIATGYAYGFDARLNGQFIKGVDSWVSLGLLKTREDVAGDDEGYVPRPADQRITFAMYFQDEMPMNPTYKVHVSYIYNSGMRFGPPGIFENRTVFGFPAYHRVDLGFSKLISFKGAAQRQHKYGMESIWATLEIFNLLQRENTVSYTWIKDLDNNVFAVNNFLSARLVNARVIISFR